MLEKRQGVVRKELVRKLVENLGENVKKNLKKNLMENLVKKSLWKGTNCIEMAGDRPE